VDFEIIDLSISRSSRRGKHSSLPRRQRASTTRVVAFVDVIKCVRGIVSKTLDGAEWPSSRIALMSILKGELSSRRDF